MKIEKDKANLEKSETVEQIRLACADETKAVEFFEAKLWKGTPSCYHCQSTNVYQMKDASGQRNKRFLWRCHDCKGQFTVRLGTVFEESRIPLRHWAYAFWRSSTSKKGASALEIKRQCQISYKSALFLMHRIRFALTSNAPQPKLAGTVEVDETYIGGKPRPSNNQPRGTVEARNYSAKQSEKVPVVALIERNGDVRAKVVANVNQNNLRHFVGRNIDKSATVNTDQFGMYRTMFFPWARHDTVNHSAKEYARVNADGTISHVNSCESFFALIKRGLMGTYHAVSDVHLHRYVGEFEFRWNTRQLNDGDRTVLAIQGAAGKRLAYYGK